MLASRLIVITGLSGSGKSTALKTFEDLGYFCVDNLPAELLPAFVQFLVGDLSGSNESVSSRPYALLLECRELNSFSKVFGSIKKLENEGISVEVLFLDSQDEVLVRRFRETRRPHPILRLNEDLQTVAHAIRRERNILSDAREAASRIIDTSLFSPHDLRRAIEAYMGAEKELKVFVTSFGFKYGTPHDADLIVDVRFLPNPHFEEKLRKKTGKEKQVEDFVFSSGDAEVFLKKYVLLLEFLIPLYRKEGKHYLTIGVGCTGGRHRSVTISRSLAGKLEKLGLDVHVEHRDLE